MNHDRNVVQNVFFLDPVTKAGRPAKTYIQQLCTDSVEELPEAMEDRDGLRERVREIRDGSATWFGLVYFIGVYGISTFVGYLMPNPFLSK